MPAKREVVGLWPHFYATIRILCHRLQEHIFVVLLRGCELLASRAMIAHDNLIFMLYRNERTTIILFSSYHVHQRAMQASEKWPRGIVKSKPVRTLYCENERQQLRFLCHIVSEAMTGVFFTLRMAYRKKRRQRAYFLRHIAKGDDAIACESMSIIVRTQATSRHCNTWLSIARMTTMIVFFASYRDEQATTTTFFRSIAREQVN